MPSHGYAPVVQEPRERPVANARLAERLQRADALRDDVTLRGDQPREERRERAAEAVPGDEHVRLGVRFDVLQQLRADLPDETSA